jgi:hypothetical protein
MVIVSQLMVIAFKLPPLPPSASSASSHRSFNGTGPFTASKTNALPGSRQAFSQIPPQPLHPPPTSSLPPLPSLSPKIPTRSHSRDPSISSQMSTSSPPPSPQQAKTVSSRSSSLLSPAQLENSRFSGRSGSGSGSAPTSPTVQQAGPSSYASKPPRTPSRYLLQSALDLAQKAVEMDKNNDVAGALSAYTEAVTRLKSVMERVGVDPQRPEAGGDRKSRRSVMGGKTEEEGRTLRGIVSHDQTQY